LPDLSGQQFEKIIANLLRLGVSVAATVVLLSGICYLAGHGGEHANYAVFQPAAYSFLGVEKGIRAGDCVATIEFGLLLLIATPVLRVGVSFVEFLRERDYRFAALTLAVLLILLGSLTF
jgi:uncharacterized membrane protein